jgi:SnoaL-like domain
MSEVADQLDSMHAIAKEAFERRDLDSYRDIFASDLKYRRADGRIVGRDSLIRDARTQFRRYSMTGLSFVRESLDVDGTGDRVTEIMTRSLNLRTSAFFVVHREWEYIVRSRNKWRKDDSQWRIEEIEVLEQRIGPGRFSIGFHSRRET